ncbi:hypothetical protein RA276_30050, partial [Pseudomonas syringae pv. tagetis]|uniref:hypothetical protein n=1 Tax=Pseudomonas syringae group genomosp. 7 TaxID=251699 RepID=UPI0037706873
AGSVVLGGGPVRAGGAAGWGGVRVAVWGCGVRWWWWRLGVLVVAGLLPCVWFFCGSGFWLVGWFGRFSGGGG